MRTPHARPFVLLVLFGLAGLGCQPKASTHALGPDKAKAESAESLVQRGRYLVQIAGCNDCHTEGYGATGGQIPESEWLLGSRAGFHGPWGTSYPTNLRLSAGRMSEADWLAYTASLQARPLMPAYTLRTMHEADRRAIYRFLRTLGPAGEPAPAALPPGQTPPAPYLDMVLPADGPGGG